MPVVAVSPNAFAPSPDRVVYRTQRLEYVDTAMQALVRRAGGVALMAASAQCDTEAALDGYAQAALERCDGLILTGGEDVGIDPLRDRWERALFDAAVAADLPVLGICRGLQLLNVILGGTLVDDLPTDRPSDVSHRAADRASDHSHALTWASDVAQWEARHGPVPRVVNSVHHQGIDAVAPTLKPLAWAEDGLIEAVVHRDNPAVIGVQWHPEWMGHTQSPQRLVRGWLERR